MGFTFTAGVMGVGRAVVTTSFYSKGFSASNIAIVYEVGAVRRSYDPNTILNSVNSFTAGKDYCIITKADMDLSDVFGFAGTTLPADTPYDVQGSGSNENRIVEGNNESYLTPFQSYNIRVLRNNVPLVQDLDFIWDYDTALATWTVAPELSEFFLIQAVSR